MQQLENKMTLYHGSYCVVEKPDLKKCANFNVKDQYCFRTEKAISKLQFIKSEKVVLE